MTRMRKRGRKEERKIRSKLYFKVGGIVPHLQSEKRQRMKLKKDKQKKKS